MVDIYGPAQSRDLPQRLDPEHSTSTVKLLRLAAVRALPRSEVLSAGR
jgi:hypothetical protein